jgi:hypothetical protein
MRSLKLRIKRGRGRRVQGSGTAFKRILSENPTHKTVKLNPQMRQKLLLAVFKKYKGMGDGSLNKERKHEIMDAGDGYQRYVLEDMTDGELLTFGRWKGIIG